MTNQNVINFLNQVRKMLLDDKSWLESTIQPINEAFDKAISALQAQEAKHSNESSLTQKAFDIISRQAAIDAMGKLYDADLEAYGCEIPEMFHSDRAIEALNALPSAQPNGWLEQNKDKILQAGMEGREIDFRIGGRLFAIREKAQ